ncbi:MAG: hypothetical protein JWQ90_2547 [Hydrocarboniphaga sp.]|nr:hypothetical protein [Hydrocarboniphaga sp.]
MESVTANEDEPPPPPSGYESWLDYAVENFDTRDIWLESMFSDNSATYERTKMRDAARSELRDLRAAALARK